MPSRRRLRVAAFAALSLVLATVLVTVGRVGASDWRTASREPVGLAPAAADAREAIVQVYGARAWGWRGTFGVHTWVAVKPADATEYTVYEVLGWQLRWSDSVVAIRNRAPDARWYGSEPELLAQVRGSEAAALIPRIDAAARSYPYAGQYKLWPGPNSNTFTAWIARAVPELEVDFPATAIGKDYLGARLFARAPSGAGGQFSVAGVFGLSASMVEGIELNVLGLNFGVNPFAPSIKLPLVGRFGASASVD